MLDREHIVPTPVLENHEPLTTLISKLENAKDEEVYLSLENILSTTDTFEPEHIKKIDRIIVDLQKNHDDVSFYQRAFELVLKMYNFCNDWKRRMRICKIHEKHRFKIHNNECTIPPLELIVGIMEICKSFMSKKKLVYDRVNILGHCVLELGKRNDGVIYEGADDIFYLIEYVYRRDSATLSRWARNVKVMNDWTLLYITNYPDFLYMELKYSNEPMVIREVIEEQRSHRLCNFLFIKLSMLFSREDMLNILFKSYDEANVSYTVSFFLKLFNDSPIDAERLLKRFIKKTNTKKLSELFYGYCTRIDGDYVEACLVCIDDIELISQACLRTVIDSHYWPYLTHKYENFAIFVRLLARRGLSPKEEYDFLNSNIGVSLENLKKTQLIATEIPNSRNKVAKVLVELIRKMFKGKTKCNECYEQQNEVKLSNSSITSFVRKDTNRKNIPGEKLLIIHEILDIIRDQSVPSKVMYMLFLMNPDLFCTRVINETRYDCFFIKCMNVMLKEVSGAANWAVEDIFRMPLFKNDGFWEVSVRRLLKLRYLWKEIAGSSEYGNNALETKTSSEEVKKKRNGLYSLENSVVVYSASKFQADCGHSVSESVDRKDRRSLFEDESKMKYLRLFNDEVKLKYLIKQLERAEKNYEHLRNIVDQLKISSRVSDGMVFKDSYIVFTFSFKLFSLQILLTQYNEKGEQVFVQLENAKQVLKIGRVNGKLFLHEVDRYRDDRRLLNESGLSGMNVAFQSFFKGSNFSFTINGNSYSSRISCVDKVTIGTGLQGIVSKILLCEAYLDKYVLSHLYQASFYVKELADIEKLLIYKNCDGVYMDSAKPYFINGRIGVDVRDVLNSKCFYWNYNEEVMKLVSECQDTQLQEVMNAEPEDVW